jgi:hypothetical protein
MALIMKITAKYVKVNGVYHIDLICGNDWIGGGNTGCRFYDGAYEYACQIAQTKGGRIERFIPDNE